MIAILCGAEGTYDEARRARSWETEYRAIEAARALSKVRRAALLKRALRIFGMKAASADRGDADRGAFTEEGNGAYRVHGRATASVDAIVGTVSADGKFGPLPIPKLAWKKAWRRLWTADLDSFGDLPVLRGPDGWYLADRIRSAMILELLRSKGGREARIVVGSPFGPEAACADTDGSTSARAYRTVNCGSGLGCCGEEPIAV